ncbi:embryo-specific protein ATS3A-like [Magnolia sinica]|uniref:embryo-specific protein ATS3A-like n=1 Tax=Magnolia sinica TaxID=86752 RepID=UPI002658FAC8|nr:embryo-specific protein ATS3A-like [Magnolia sinica]
MVGRVWFFLFLALFFLFSKARSTNPQPQELKSLKIQNTQSARGCSYVVSIKTSCSSRSFTRDMVSLAFGDAYGNQIYVPRLDDPDSRTFERCSTDTYTLSGTCMYKICYLYLLRRGSDGWKPESVKVYPPNSKAITFKYNMFLPNGVWYGFNSCNGVSSHINGTGNLISQM